MLEFIRQLVCDDREKLKRHRLIPVQIFETEYTGIASVSISPYFKPAATDISVPRNEFDNSQAEFSQKASKTRHLQQLDSHLNSFKADDSLKHIVCTKGDKIIPYMVIYSDGGQDQNFDRLENLIPSVEFFQNIDLDFLELWNFCPGNSKMNPAELG